MENYTITFHTSLNCRILKSLNTDYIRTIEIHVSIIWPCQKYSLFSEASVSHIECRMQRNQELDLTLDSSSDDEMRLQIDETACDHSINPAGINHIPAANSLNNKTQAQKRIIMDDKQNVPKRIIRSRTKKNPSELFLLSLLPQVTNMTPLQLLRFQRGVVKLIQRIIYPEPS